MAPHTLGVWEVYHGDAGLRRRARRERRRELAFEGDRWPDLVHPAGSNAPEHPGLRTLFLIPQNETDVAPRIVQNSGY
ncbi:MAG: hypothetical protein IPJ56_18190 [Gemmatimonadetes bacterium]|nr:hypothetical protein [Gemmatimonadota bacterium]